LLLTLLPIPAFAQEAPPVFLLGAEAVEEDLHLTLLWNEDYPFQDPEVVLRTDAGNILTTQSVEPSGPVAVVEVLEGALSDLWEFGFALVVEIQENGMAVGNALPFFALRQCDPDPCSWKLLVGVQTDALLTTAHLDALVETTRQRYNTCDLSLALDAVEQLHPNLFEEILQVHRQIDDLQIVTGSSGGGACAYAWHSVVEHHPTWSDFYQVLSTNQGVTDAEEGGYESGAAYHHGIQAQRVSPGGTYPPTAAGIGASAVTLDLRCTAGPASCATGCQGSVSGALSYSSYAEAHSDLHVAGGSAYAWAWEDVTLDVNGVTELQQAYSLSSYAGQEVALESYSAFKTTLEPATFQLTTHRQLQVHASYQPPGSLLPHLPEQGAAHAYADVQNQFVLTVIGTAPACPGQPTTTETVTSPPFRDAGFWKEQGGLRIEKWLF
jgi:hypothetical protein